MEPEEAAEHVETDPNLESVEKEFSVGFSKDHDQATFHAAIASMVRRCLAHSDMEIENIRVYDESDESYQRMDVEEFDGDGAIVEARGRVPIESLKVNSNPRSHRSFAQIISQQTEVNIGD